MQWSVINEFISLILVPGHTESMLALEHSCHLAADVVKWLVNFDFLMDNHSLVIFSYFYFSCTWNPYKTCLHQKRLISQLMRTPRLGKCHCMVQQLLDSETLIISYSSCKLVRQTVMQQIQSLILSLHVVMQFLW